jgi:D-glycero-alpha-D-manno-heptose-7-phosphate kinase
VIVASAPTRLDFGGGWTDVPPFPEERGGFVCNLAIERRATVQLELGSAHAPPPADPLIAAAFRRAGLCHAQVRLTSNFPVGAGLGGSSAAGVALQAAIAAAGGHSIAPQSLAEASRGTEVDEMGVAGGFQDHYAAAFGGALGLSLTAVRHAEPIPLTRAAIASLEARICVIYTGEARISAATITAVLDAYRDRVPRVVQALDRMRDLARAMAEALHAGNVSELAGLVDEHWVHQQSLHAAITTPRITAIEHAVRAVGAEGFKALGASGGGCVIAMAPVNRMHAVRRAAGALGEVLEWKVARSGVMVVRDGVPVMGDRSH